MIWKRRWRIVLLGGIALVVLLGTNAFRSTTRSYATVVYRQSQVEGSNTFGVFEIANVHRDRISFYVNNIEVRSGGVWRYSASWSMGSETHPILGKLHNYVQPGESAEFRVKAPAVGDAWRINVGILRGIRRLSLWDRVRILSVTRTPAAVFTPTVRSNYFRFKATTIIRGPEIDQAAARWRVT